MLPYMGKWKTIPFYLMRPLNTLKLAAAIQLNLMACTDIWKPIFRLTPPLKISLMNFGASHKGAHQNAKLFSIG